MSQRIHMLTILFSPLHITSHHIISYHLFSLFYRSTSQSKEGRGKYAFGSAEQDAEEATKNPAAALAGSSEQEEEEAEVAAPAEPEVPSMTTEEFMAERAAKKAELLALVGARKERKVERVGTLAAKAEVDELLGGVGKLSVATVSISKRLQSKVAVDIKYGFKSEQPEYESRGDRGDRPPRTEGGDRPRENRPPREDRPPREPREGGKPQTGPPRAPRQGDDGARPPRSNRDAKGGKPQNGSRPNKGGTVVNFTDQNAFPSL